MRSSHRHSDHWRRWHEFAGGRKRVEAAASIKQWIWWGTALAIALLDQSIKQLVQTNLAYAQTIPVTPFFNLVHNVLG